MKSQLENLESSTNTLTNAAAMAYNKKHNYFHTMVQSSQSKLVYHVKLQLDGNTAKMKTKATGQAERMHTPKMHAEGKLLCSLMHDELKVFIYQSGSNMPFLVLHDVDSDALGLIADLRSNGISKEDVIKQASNIHDQSNSVEGRPDKSEAADLEALADAILLRGEG